MANTEKEIDPRGEPGAEEENKRIGDNSTSCTSQFTSRNATPAMLHAPEVTAETPLAEAALAWAENGWVVVQGRSWDSTDRDGRKTGKASRWRTSASEEERLNHHTTDPERIRKLWEQHPQSNVGVMAPEGYVILDFDPNHGGTAEALAERFGLDELPETTVLRSGGAAGGYHLPYRLPEGFDATTIKNSTNNPIPGVDVRTHGKGFVIAAPSRHPETGEHYTVERHGPVGVLPVSIAEAMAGVEGGQFSGWSLQRLWNNPPVEGGRNDWLTRIAGHYARDFAPDRREEYDFKLTEANRQLRDSLGADEVAKTADSIWSTQLETLDAEKREAVPSPQEALASARWLQENHFTHSDGARTLWHFGGDWWLWSERLGWFEKYSTDRLQDRVALAFEHRHYMTSKGKRAWAPTPNKTLAVVVSLRAISRIEDQARVDNGRAWVGVTGPWPAIDTLPVANGLLNIRTRELIPHTPALFATAGVPAPYEAGADAPVWRGFVSVVFEKLARELVQQWFGYVLSGRTDQQKMLYLHGKGGTGKGTSHRVLEILIGGDETETVVATEINDLKQDFGMAHWVGASLVCFADADEGFNIGKQGLARLKTITGGDRMSINIKGKDYWRGVPSFRMMWLSNNPPMWAGDAGPMVRRLLSVRTTGERVDLLGSEGQSIEDLVRPELSGVLNWALDGLDLLNRRQRQNPNESPWTQSETHDEDMRNMLDSDRMTAFLDHHVPTATEEEEGHEVAVEAPALYQLYKQWCEENGHDRPGPSGQFYAEFTKYTDLPKHRPKPGAWVGGSGKAERPYLFVLVGRKLANVSNAVKPLKRAT